MPLPWTDECETAFRQLRQALCSAPVLGTPDYMKPFALYIHEKDGCALSVLVQTHGDKQRPCAYFSALLDPVARALPGCFRSVAATAVSIRQREGIVLSHKLLVLVPHAVDALLNQTKTQHLTSARMTGCELTLLAPHITLKRCATLNPATLLPYPVTQPQSQETHDCIFLTEEQTKGRIDLQDTPLPDVDGELWVDGSCLKLPDGTTSAAYAITTIHTVVETARIPQKSAQAVELIALTQACELSTDLCVNIYTDSRYAFGVAHDFGLLWKERGFLTSHGIQIMHGELVHNLLTALQYPKKLAIVKCSAHKKVTDKIGQGNALADRVARETAMQRSTTSMYVVKSQAERWHNARQDVLDIQKSASVKEREQWSEEGKLDDEGCWRNKQMDKWKLPIAFVQPMVQMAHGLAHVGASTIRKLLTQV
ncbi:hypothetical protein NDU88_003188 [Pleurodeles waltl]|uniref:RNase H type-1 domain-containing protein n=1 Tax=Pleurodeles waltl TaxID=8319 RepID=A0AAV7WU04_PLEWA|nr:hypothetical protein NDU88_003188 [Pleurodeles waltl]